MCNNPDAYVINARDLRCLALFSKRGLEETMDILSE